MDRVTRPDERIAALVKPALQPTDQFRLSSSDCLVVCAGFEDRALGVLKNPLASSSDFTVVIIKYLPLVAANRLSDIRDLCRQARLRTIETEYDRENPAGFAATLIEKTADINGRLFIDVSAMSRLLIVQILVELAAREKGFRDCVVAYAEATYYPPGPDEVEQLLKKSDEDPTFSILLLSSGVFGVTVIPELSSTAIGGAQTRLVAFPTLSADQLTALRLELQPSRLTFINGIPPNPGIQWRTGAIAKINRLDTISQEEGFRTSTLDYRETLDCLLHLYAKHSERERLLVSPTGSKMQTVAVGLFRAFMEDIQIVYPTPQKFLNPMNYTKGVGQLHSLQLDAFTDAMGQPDSQQRQSTNGDKELPPFP